MFATEPTASTMTSAASPAPLSSSTSRLSPASVTALTVRPRANLTLRCSWRRCTSRPTSCPDGAFERRGQWLDHRDLAAALHRGRGHLAADEAGTDDHDASAGSQVGGQAERVVEGADRVPPGQLAAQVEPARAHAGGHDQAVPRDGLPVGEGQRVRVQVDALDAGPEPPLDVLGGRALPERQPVALHRAAEQLLRERRPVVRRVLLVAEHDDPAGVPGGAQPLAHAQAGQARSDDGDVLSIS